ncbi:MAG: apolipoprotein N-acyltransferase, partial [Proteobacteria bacterium]|nr:apolipoprotein N-acyltransferase [Pseudomonadota bacterium]
MIKKERLNILLSILTGVLTALSFEPFSISIFGFFAYIPLFFVFERTEKSLRKILIYAWLSMFITAILCFQWIHFVAVEFGLLPKWAAFLILIGFSLLTNFSLQIFSVLYHFAGRFTGWTKNYVFYFLIVPSLFVISEFLDPRIFNWYIGNLLSSFKYLPQFADFFGVYGLSFFTILINISVFLIVKYLIKYKKLGYKNFNYKKLIPGLSVIVAVLLFLEIYGYYNYGQIQKLEDKCPKIRAAVIQANIGNPMQLEINQAAKLRKEIGTVDDNSDQALILKKYEIMTKKAVEENSGIDLIVWPETAFPGYYVERNPQMAEHRKMVEELGVPFLIGGYYIESDTGRYYNSAILSTKDRIDYYHKNIRLPFGEYMPMGETIPLLKRLVPSVGDFSKGSGAMTLDLIINGLEVRFAPTICYEILKSDYVREMYNKDAHVFLNLSNDSWFGVVEPYHHLRLARMKALEFRRPIIRSTNTGITTLIDMNGMMVKAGGLNKEDVLVFDVPICDHRLRTVYATFGYLFP